MPGRPRKSPLDKRSFPLAVRFRFDEVTQLDLFAAAANQTVSEYIRDRSLTDRPAPGLSATIKHDVYRLLLTIERGLRDGASAEFLAGKVRAVLAELER